MIISLFLNSLLKDASVNTFNDGFLNGGIFGYMVCNFKYTLIVYEYQELLLGSAWVLAEH